jgi:integral membrane protein (TIGR01906 family)
MGVVRGLAKFIFIIAIPIALVGINVRFLANEDRIYTYAIDEYDASARTGIAREELVRSGRDLQKYFNSDAELFYTRVNQAGHETPLFNNREILHLADVKDVLNWVYRIQEVAFVYIVAYAVGVFIWAREQSLRSLALSALAGGLLTIGVIGALAVTAVTGFERAFEQFHLIAFTNDLWQLDPNTDRLIQIFPEDFWFDVTMLLGLLTIGEAALISLVATIHLTVTPRTPSKITLAATQQHA